MWLITNKYCVLETAAFAKAASFAVLEATDISGSQQAQPVVVADESCFAWKQGQRKPPAAIQIRMVDTSVSDSLRNRRSLVFETTPFLRRHSTCTDGDKPNEYGTLTRLRWTKRVVRTQIFLLASRRRWIFTPLATHRVSFDRSRCLYDLRLAGPKLDLRKRL
jgi:hypothetical protein